MGVLKVRKLADRSEGQRVHRYHTVTGERHLVDPVDNQAKPWPFLGVKIEGDTPEFCRVSTSWVNTGVKEGWIELTNPRPVHQPGGPPDDLWKVTHTFIQADYVTLKTVDGDVRFKVTAQPDKYDDDTEASGKRVDWFYDLELVKTGGLR